MFAFRSVFIHTTFYVHLKKILFKDIFMIQWKKSENIVSFAVFHKNKKKCCNFNNWVVFISSLYVLCTHSMHN